jgi:CRISPR/Cas system-associated exonuclease Cas4 (RecB family)
MPDFVPISYSRISSFKECPKKFYEMSIAKSVPFVQSEQMRQGEVIHKMLEERVTKDKPFPKGYEYLENYIAPIMRAPGHIFTEMQLTFTPKLIMCGAKDWDNAWLRIIIDVAKMRDGFAWAGDYKSGKRHFDELQLKITAAGMFQAFPQLEQVATNYLWLQEKGVDEPSVYKRSDAPAIWEEIFQYSRLIEEAKRTNTWPAQKNKWCAWCAVNRAGRCQEAIAWGVKPR